MFTPIIYPKTKSLTQGVIFAGGLAENYGDCQTYGLIITARCDVTNDKIETYNYFPVIPLDPWLRHEGRLILAERLAADSYAKLTNCLKQIKQSPSILETENPRRVLELLFDATQRSTSRVRQSFQIACEHYEIARQVLLDIGDTNHCRLLYSTAPKLLSALLRELAQQKLTGYYFLPRIEPDGSDDGFVVLLREIRHIPRRLARAICDGVSLQEYNHMISADDSLSGRLRIMTNDVAMPVGLLQSPNIEHLMQCFSMLFGRIGIADVSGDYIERLWLRQPGIKEAEA